LILSGVAALIVATGALYWAMPGWRIKRQELDYLLADDDPELTARLLELTREAGLPRPPIFLVDGFNPAATGLAFGRVGRRYVLLNGGLLTAFRRDRSLFDVVVRHELGHLRNGDVDKTYLAIAVWWAFLGVAVVPTVLTTIGRYAYRALYGPPITADGLSVTFQAGWRLAALALLVTLTRNAVLRTRELYADARAAAANAPLDGFERALGALAPDRVGWLGRSSVHDWPLVRRAREALMLHPDPAARRRALDDPAILLRLGPATAFGTGVVAALALQDVDHLLLGPFVPMGLNQLRAIGAALVFAPLAVGVVGIGLWRMAYAATLRGGRPHGAGRRGLLLGLGLVTGQYLSLTAAAPATPIAGAAAVTFDVLWGGLLLGSLWVLLRWIAGTATVCLAHAGRDLARARPVYRVGLLLAGAVLSLWLGALTWLHSLRGFGADMQTLRDGVGEIVPSMAALDAPVLVAITLAVMVVGLLAQPVHLVAAIALWIFPMAAERYLRMEVARTAPASLRPAMAAVSGVAAAALVIAIEIAMWQVGARGLLQVLLLAMVAQVAVGMVVSARAPQLGVWHGALAASVAGAVLMLANHLNAPQLVDPWAYWSVWGTSMAGGALLALIAALGTSAVAERWRG
jgi:Zn-dependent protease with chaperone function